MPERVITKPDEMEWVTISAGEFIMGSDAATGAVASRRLIPNFLMSGWTVSNRNEKSIFPNTPLRNTR